MTGTGIEVRICFETKTKRVQNTRGIWHGDKEKAGGTGGDGVGLERSWSGAEARCVWSGVQDERTRKH